MDKNLSICILLEIQQYKKYYKIFVYLEVARHLKPQINENNNLEL